MPSTPFPPKTVVAFFVATDEIGERKPCVLLCSDELLRCDHSTVDASREAAVPSHPKDTAVVILVRNRPRRRIRDLRLHKQRPLHSLNFHRPQRLCADRDRRSRKKQASASLDIQTRKGRKNTKHSELGTISALSERRRAHTATVLALRWQFRLCWDQCRGIYEHNAGSCISC